MESSSGRSISVAMVQFNKVPFKPRLSILIEYVQVFRYPL